MSGPRAERYGKFYSAAFLRYLRRYLPGFRRQPERVQLAVMEMIQQAPSQYRAHATYDGWSSFHYRELERMFGRGGFDCINEQLRVFHYLDDWSKTEGRTKPYILTEKAAALRDRFLAGVTRRTTGLLSEDGRAIHKLAKQAQAAKRKDRKTQDGKIVRGQNRAGFNEPIEPAVPVRQDMLRKFLESIEGRLYALKHGFEQGGLFHASLDERYLKDLQRQAATIYHLASNNISPGTVPHRYEQSASGRLYAVGVNLQNAFLPVRQAAMTGMFDYDIENAHFAILEQMAQRHGYECRAIGHYLANKKAMRSELAAEFGLTVRQVKEALIALVYGARFSARPEDSLPTITGSIEVAKRMYAHPVFTALKVDIAAARAAILRVPASRQKLWNARRLTIDVRHGNKPQQLAHLLQGVESVALEAMHRVDPAAIVLLQHDGCTATRLLDTTAMEAAILRDTGYKLRVTTDGPVACELDEAFDSGSLKNQLESAGNPLPVRVSIHPM